MHIVTMKRERMDILREKWEEQRKLLLSEYETEYLKNKSKGAKMMLKKLREIDFQLRDIIMKLYLNKCRTEHNVAFFEWRKNFKEEAHELMEKYSKKLEKDIAHEDNMVEDKAEFNNELRGFNLNHDRNESLSSVNASVAVEKTGKKVSKTFIPSKLVVSARKGNLKK